MGMREGFTIGDLAGRCSVSRDTLRFYEREGLLTPPRRSASSYRLHGEADAARVRFIRRVQATGLTLDDIRELVTGPAAPDAGGLDRIVAQLGGARSPTDPRSRPRGGDGEGRE